MNEYVPRKLIIESWKLGRSNYDTVSVLTLLNDMFFPFKKRLSAYFTPSLLKSYDFDP